MSDNTNRDKKIILNGKIIFLIEQNLSIKKKYSDLNSKKF